MKKWRKILRGALFNNLECSVFNTFLFIGQNYSKLNCFKQSQLCFVHPPFLPLYLTTLLLTFWSWQHCYWYFGLVVFGNMTILFPTCNSRNETKYRNCLPKYYFGQKVKISEFNSCFPTFQMYNFIYTPLVER